MSNLLEVRLVLGLAGKGDLVSLAVALLLIWQVIPDTDGL